MKKLLFYLIFTTISFFGFAQTPYWSYSFDGGSLTDEVGNDDLTQTGSALTTVSDRFSNAGDAVSLNGDVLEGGNVSPTAPVTMSYAFWIKDAVNDANERIIIDHFGTIGFGNSIRLLNGKIKVVGRPGYFNGSNWQPSFSETQFLTSTTNVADGNWHHVVVNVAQRGNQPQITDYELYVDGSLEESSFANESNITAQLYRPYRTPSPFLIGDNVAGSDRYENTIDDINFYTADLSQAQVTTLFNVRPPQVVYVDQDATGASDGSSWADAFTDLQSALSYATVPGDKLWIAEGVYKPDASDRQVFFTLPADMEVYGGFNGTETQLSQRDWHTYETIISGDLQGNDNSNVTYNEATRSDNSYRLFIVSGNGVVLDGLVLESAQGNWTSSVAFSRGSAITKGAGVSNLVLRNSTFRKNVARIGVIYFNFTSTVTNSILIESCDFHNNFAIYGAGLSSATNEAGAVTDIEVYNSRFFNNEAGDISGGTGFSGSSMSLFANEGTINATIVNNTFAYNQDNGTEPQDAGTIILRRLDNSASDVTNLELHNNIFFGNTKAGNPNSVAIGLMNRQNNDITSVNLSNNVIDYGTLANRSVSITPSGLQDDSDPDFIDGPNGDLRLTSSSWVIDAGDNTKLPVSITKDVDGEDRILNSTIDIGAHEFDPSICNPPVAINTQPDDESVCAGDDVTLSVAAAGNTVTYQWQLDGVDISGATSSSLTINSVAQGDVGDYTVVVSDACNDVTSSAASLSLTEETGITLVVLGPTDVCEGGDFTTPDLASSTQGDNLSYQWSYDGVPLNGETGSALNLTDFQLSDAGTYSVEATGTCGTDQLSFPVTVTESTAITSQPSDETLCAGDDATLSVSATGDNLSYQWVLGSLDINGETTATLELTNVGGNDAGPYTVEVTGTCGTVTSDVATVQVFSNTAITQQPSDITACEGTGNNSFQVIATGTNVDYQWYQDGVALAGETSSVLNLGGVVLSEAGIYTVDVIGACGTITSNSADLIVNELTSISTQPSNETACEGSNITLSVAATGSNLSYQWTKDGSNISGASSASLVLNNAQLSDAGDYEVVVTGDCGTETSSTAMVMVNQGISVTQQPATQSACDGDDVAFTVAATGTGLSYQWTKDGNNISGATSTSLILNGVSSADAGDYAVEITASCGTLSSNTANLSVDALTAISTQPSNETTCEGGNITLSVVATGANLTYQWTKDGSNISGATSASLALNNAQLSDAGDYEVVVSGDCGVETSSTATVTVNQGISITQQPSSSSACPGDNVQFDLVATGTGLTYQWFKDNNSINGATSASLSLNNVQASDAGDYSVEITASCGTVNSNVATLTIGTTTAITQQPSGITVCEGVDTNLTVVANGSNLTYQWNFNGSPITGATSDVLSLTNVQTSDDGSYTVDITGDCGTETSTNVAVTINSNPGFFQQPGILNPLCLGDTVTLSSSVLGNTFGSQWLLNGATIPGETGADITIENITVADTGNYVREVTGECGVFYSVEVNLNPEPNTNIISQPTDINVCAGDQAAFTVDAEGGNLSYEWFLNENSIGTVLGSTNVVTSAADSTDEGFYYAIVTGECGVAQSDSAELTVTTLSPQITESNGELSTGTFDSYQWYLNGNVINGATSQSYSPMQNGNYTVEVINVEGCSAISDAYSFVGTSIKESEIVDLQVYPNPAQDNVMIQTDEDLLSIKLYGLSGKLVKQFNPKHNNLDVDNLAEGIYFLNLKTNEHSSVVKLILQK